MHFDSICVCNQWWIPVRSVRATNRVTVRLLGFERFTADLIASHLHCGRVQRTICNDICDLRQDQQLLGNSDFGWTYFNLECASSFPLAHAKRMFPPVI